MAVKLSIFVTHPVQYHVPLWRALSRHPALDVTVNYFSDHSIRGGIDKDFGVPVAWDVDLLSGYAHHFVTRDANLERPASVRARSLDALLNAQAPDWLWISGYTHGFERQLARLARKRRSRLIMRAEFSDLSYGARSPLKQLARTAYLRWFYRRVDRFCFPGEMGKAHLLRHGVPAAKLFFSPYSVDDEQIQRQQGQWTKPAARKQLGLAADDFVFLLSGKLIARKNPLAVVEAIRRMPRSERVALVVIGDGELRANFEAEARRLLGERLLAPGFVNQSQLGPYFVAADALLMPSLHETWGLVVNEAMHFGLPVIVSDRVGCHPNLVREGETGFVYDAAQPEQLAGHMQRLVDDPAAAAAMGHRAREQMVHYTIDASARGVFSALGL